MQREAFYSTFTVISRFYKSLAVTAVVGTPEHTKIAAVIQLYANELKSYVQEHVDETEQAKDTLQAQLRTCNTPQAEKLTLMLLDGLQVQVNYKKADLQVRTREFTSPIFKAFGCGGFNVND